MALSAGALRNWASSSPIIDGKELWRVPREEIDGVPNVFASPGAALGRVYCPGREGTTIVIRPSRYTSTRVH